MHVSLAGPYNSERRLNMNGKARSIDGSRDAARGHNDGEVHEPTR